ncbi:uncharacterized protein LOC106136269 isoform X2 [Amyelois transitella]|uniref:uncharacterized protein LOC106136269 isoform X2 n=1 Tax=Amyelois transitella TaxID=680683 RepID=UPI00067BA307|nr:uncharacterized protein LOC106136269 isoform X2 [Amyelois transitella]
MTTQVLADTQACMVYEHKYLKKDAVPSVFHWNKKESTKQAKARSLRLQTRNARKSLFEDQPSTSSNEDLLSIQDEYLEVESHDSDESAEVVEEEVAVPKLNRIVTKISNILLKLNRNIAGKQSNS